MPHRPARRRAPAARVPLLILLITVVAAAVVLPHFVQLTAYAAATFTVNSLSDGADSNTADNLCADGSGNCTLRAAIQQANATPGADTIAFSVTGTINLTGALPNIASDLTMTGPGPGLLTVRRDTGGDYRIFTVMAGTVTISGMTITNGKTADGPNRTAEQPGAGIRGEFGGGVYNERGAVLTLANCVISNNATGRGGDAFSSTFETGGSGGLGGAIFNLGSLVVTECVISGNRTGRGGKGDATANRGTGGGGKGGDGGGLWSAGFATLTITNSSIVNNVCGDGGPGDGTFNTAGQGGYGGGLYYDVVTGVPNANVSGTTFSGNQTGNGGPNGGGGFGAGHGGGIYIGLGPMTLTNSVVTGNRTGTGAAPAGPSGGGGWGGGIFSFGTLDIVASTISNNQTGGGSGSAPAGNGAGIRNGGTLTLTNSTVSGNTTGSAANGTPGTAGGVYNSNTLLITGSTLSGNTGGGGSAVYNLRNLTLTNSTVSGNRIPSVNFHDGAIVDDSDNVRTRIINCTITANDGPGVQADIADNFSDSSPRVGNTIIAGNGNGGMVDANGLYVSLGHNFIGKGTGSNGFTDGNMGDRVGPLNSFIDPFLGPLADNGGPTLTHAPFPGSPVLDAGDNAIALDPAGNPLTTDQRGPGFPRVADWADADTTQTVDIGAFETHPFVENVTNKTTDEDTQLSIPFNVGDSALGVTVTATSSNQALLPDANISVTGSGQTRTLNATPLANASGTTTVTLTVTAANGRSVTDSFVYSVTAINDAPVNSVPAAQTTVRNTPLVFSAANSNAITVADVDSGDARVTLAAANGTLTLGTTAGLAFTSGDGTDDATMTFTGTLANINVALSGLTFTPAQGFNGAASVQITTDDQGNTGSGGARSDADAVSVNVLTGGSLQLSAAAFEAGEGAGTATLTVTRTGGSAGSTSVNYATSGGTATAGGACGSGADYVTAAGTLTWADGDTADKTVSVTLCDDPSNEPDETFGVSLSGPAGSAALGTPSSATVTIKDDDPTGGRIEFSQSVYTAGENSFATVTVRRTGQTGLAVGVDYSTDDGSTPSVAVPCSSTTGLALHRCDFTQAVGRLSFAAGETEKTFQILVGDDSYVEGTETASVRLSNPDGGAALGSLPSATLSITDDAPETAGNPNDDSAKFVRQHYHDFFSREPDAPGLAHWTNVIESCGSNAQCREVNRINVSGAFFLSIEFRETGFLVTKMYKAAYGDATGTSTLGGTHQLSVPVIRFEEFLPDTQRIGRGVVVHQPGWEAQIEANKTAFTQEFVQRQRFLNDYPLSLTPTDFVDRLNGRAGGPLDASERQALINELTANNTTAGRASVLRKVAEDATLDAAERNRAFVLMQYFGYLRRNPNSGQDADYTGYDFWLGNLEKAGGNFVQAELVKAFITSTEYRQRFGQ